MRPKISTLSICFVYEIRETEYINRCAGINNNVFVHNHELFGKNCPDDVDYFSGNRSSVNCHLMFSYVLGKRFVIVSERQVCIFYSSVQS